MGHERRGRDREMEDVLGDRLTVDEHRATLFPA